jgi:hypothetical protein
MLTRWECVGSYLPKNQAKNKCLAQANAAFSSSKSTIWKQCMRGEGYQERVCREEERASADCQVIHVL